MRSNSPVHLLISILNWNHAERTQACLLSLQQAGYLARTDIEVVVTDNGSNPDDAERAALAAASCGVRFRRNSQNLGFAGGHNALLRKALTECVPFVWLLNNDCVVQPGTVEALQEAMTQDPQCAIASPCLAYEDTREVYFAGAIQNWPVMGSLWCPSPWDTEFHEQNRTRVWAVGTAILLRTSAVFQVGMLNEELFAYYEDDELAERFIRAGWRCRILKDVAVLHNRKSDQAVKRPPYFYYLMSRNWLWFYLQFTPAIHRRWLLLRLVATGCERARRLSKEGFGEISDASLLGLADGLCGRLGRPLLDRPVPTAMRCLAAVLHVVNRIHETLRPLKP